MLDAMTDKELDEPLLIDTAARERVARTSGKTEEEVARLLVFYKQSLIVQTYLVMR